MRSSLEQSLIRLDILHWLETQIDAGKYEFTREELTAYEYLGERIPLLDRGRGIRNPVDFDSTLTIMTSIDSSYADEMIGELGIGRYDYQRRDVDNSKLRTALLRGDPLVYFHPVRPAVFVPYFPVYVVEDLPEDRKFLVAMDEALRYFRKPAALTADERSYAVRITKQRLHQPLFRARVMRAYKTTCTICTLKHADLLDAAHIVDDTDELGVPSVNNGLALCKIHHAAFDRNILGITPKYVVQVNGEVLEEVDGPMLRYGLQDMHGRTLHLPSRADDHPSRDLLAIKYAEFAA